MAPFSMGDPANFSGTTLSSGRRSEAGFVHANARIGVTQSYPSIMPRRRGTALGLTVAGALFYGAAMAEIHGSQGGIRATIGNLSAPWLLVGFGAGAALGGLVLWRGALSGLLVTAAALCSFYITNIWVLSIFGHGAVGDLWLALSTGSYYIRLGLISGPVMGSLGTLWRQRRPLSLGLVSTGLLIFEPLAWCASWHGALPADFIAVAVVEIGVGVVLSAALIIWRRRSIPA